MAVLNEVSGKPGSTLVAEIGAGHIPKPDLLSWQEWVAWRSAVGERPTRSRGDLSTASAEENALWKSTMAHFYGTDWVAMQIAFKEAARVNTRAPETPPVSVAGGSGGPVEEYSTPTAIGDVGGGGQSAGA